MEKEINNNLQIAIDAFKAQNYEKAIEDLPILKINNKIALRRRFKKLCDCNVLEFHLEKNSKGTFTYYTIGKAYKTLLFDMCNAKHH
jgi:hypothetical protein